jgi:glycosyltransferase involved in cell wall biosynthesis
VSAAASPAVPEAVSVVVMAYNERDSLEAVLAEIHGALQDLRRPFEVLIVDDGSGDGTGELADRLAASRPFVRVVHHPVNGGLGAVYRTGFAEARGEYLTFFPADGQFPASILGDFVPLMTDSDLVLGYLPDRRGSLVGRVLSVVERVTYAVLFGSFPRFQGVMMLRRAILDRMTLASSGRGWAVVMELILRASRMGLRMRSVPTAFRPRMAGASKVQNLRTVSSNLRQVLELRRQL